MEIVYYYVLYLKRMSKKTPGRYKIDIHLDPFPTQARAEAYKKECDAHYGDLVHFSCVKKVDLTKHKEGIWLK